ELLAARQSVLELEKEIFTLENSFSSLLGIAPGRIERSAGLELKLPEGLSTGLSVELLRNRPDVREAEQNLVKAFYATTGARSDFYPKITLGGSAGWTDNLGCAISNPGGWILKAVGSLVQPLFNRGKNISALRGAEARQEEALLSWQQKILDAGNEVNDAMKQCHTAALHLELSRSKTAELENAVLSTELLMENGNVNYLEVLTARQALLASQIDEVEDIYDGIQGTIRLYHALGGGSR
ncbi:MAG: TolC family protein, partial [Candidatus Cryptobacteroides sp.]